MLKKALKVIIPLLKNFYFSTGFFLLIWVTFFDANDLISQIRLSGKLKDLERERDYYIARIEEVKKEKHQVFGSQSQIEKFAREHYLMKKPTEDLYIISYNR